MSLKRRSDNEMPTESDEKQAGAFRNLVEAEKDRVLNICYRFVNNAEDAEDLAQETFMEVYRSIAEFREDSSISTWIYRIAVSKSLNHIRNRNRLKRRGSLSKTADFVKETAEIPAPKSDNPDEVLEQKERQAILYQALNDLPSKQRIAFTLSKYDEMNYREIATILKTSVPSVESLIHRAKANLQKKLYAYYGKHL